MKTSADFLRELERVADSDGLYSGQFVKEALAAERRATVERIPLDVEWWTANLSARNGNDRGMAEFVVATIANAVLDEEAAS